MNLPKISPIAYKRFLIILLVVLVFVCTRATWEFSALSLQPKIEEVSSGKKLTRPEIYEYIRLLRQTRTLSKLCPYVLTCSVVKSGNGVIIANDEIAVLEGEVKFHDINQKVKDTVAAVGPNEGEQAAQPYKERWMVAREALRESQKQLMTDVQLLDVPEMLSPALSEIFR